MERDDLFAAAHELRETLEGVDWAGTPLGPVSEWSPALRTTVRLMLATRFSSTLLWGPDQIVLYNDAYVPIIGDKHPSAIGRPARDVFPEAWQVLEPIARAVVEDAEANWVVDARVPLMRHGFLEDCYFTYSYSPVAGEDGAVEGVLDLVTETTTEVLSRRRLTLLAALREALGGLDPSDDVRSPALEVLRQSPDDLVEVDIRHVGRPSRARAGRPRAAPWTERDATVPSGGVTTTGSLPLRPRDRVSPLSEVVVEESVGGAVAWVPLATLGTLDDPTVLVCRLNPRLPMDDDYLVFLRLLGAALTQPMARMEGLAAERLLAQRELAVAESLQLSLLGEPVPASGVEVAVRYSPAVATAKIGGDWYDTFCGPDGALHLVVGDVAGHDRQAAVAMAQARNIMRGVAYTLNGSPAATMEGFDQAISGLDADSLLTAVLARCVGPSDEDPTRPLELTWSNAGHPPPVVVTPDGEASFLETTPDPLLGIDPSRRRHQSTVTLPPGSTVVFYTDGLVERRGEGLSVGLDRLQEVMATVADMGVEQGADHLLRTLGTSDEDDTALLLLRTVPVVAPVAETAAVPADA